MGINYLENICFMFNFKEGECNEIKNLLMTIELDDNNLPSVE